MDDAMRLTVAERLCELSWEGFTPEDIAEAAGCPVDVIEGLYETPAESCWAKNLAMRAWRALIPPDVDEVAVERVLDGDYPPERLTPPERQEAVRQLAVLCRRSHREIAEHIHVTQRTVQRIADRLGLVEHRQDAS